MTTTETTDETRRNALQLAAEVGDAAAAKQLKIPAATIRTWRKREADAANAELSSEPLTAAEVWRTARQARAAYEQAMTRRDHLNAQRLATVYGVAIDKARAIETSITEREAWLAKAGAALSSVVAVTLDALFDDLGVRYEASAAVRQVIRHHLVAMDQRFAQLDSSSQAAESTYVAPARDAAAARAAVLASLQAEAKRERASELIGSAESENDSEVTVKRRKPKAAWRPVTKHDRKLGD
jgi:hypothetical protein